MATGDPTRSGELVPEGYVEEDEEVGSTPRPCRLAFRDFLEEVWATRVEFEG